MFEVIEVHPAGDERVVTRLVSYGAAREYAAALQEGEVWFMYTVKESK